MEGLRRSRATDRQIRDGAQRMLAAGLVVGSVGNVSARVGHRVRITPTRVGYAGLRRRDLVTVALDGTVLAGRHAPSRETPLHLAVYRERPDVRAIVHTHSPYATAWSFLDRPLTPATEEVAYYAIGDVATSVPAPAGSGALAAAAVAALGPAAAVLLGRHGVLAVGATVGDALVVAEAVEHQAHVAWLVAGAARLPADGAWGLAADLLPLP